MSSRKKKTIYVIGHRNPDTDSICSAIALANLKNKIARKKDGNCAENWPEHVVYKAVRAGHLNQETRYVLKQFGVSVPTYMRDARTQISDINYSVTESIRDNISLRQAWKIMRTVSKSTLAITDEDGQLKGVITTSDIAKSYMAVFDNCILAKARTLFENIIDTLNGTLVAGNGDGCVEQGKVVISTANTEIIRQHIGEGDVVILGNRYEAQLCALEQRASVIIVCDGAPVSRTIRKIAGGTGCAVISTEYDAYTVARLINQSLPVRHFMTKDNLITFKENNYIDDIRPVMMKERIRDFPIVTEDNHYTGMISRRNLIDMDKKQMILVDHNEADQAIAGINEVEVMEIIDHHKLGTIETIKPVIVRNQPVGCTATIIYQMYVENNIEISATMAGLLCSAIISDTLLFRSPTCTVLDKMVACKLAEIAGIDPEAHAKAMFDAGSDLKSKSNDEIFYQDFKKFKAGDKSFGVGQITSMNTEELKTLAEKLKPFLEVARKKEDADMIFFLLTDILGENSYVIFAGQEAGEVISQGFNREPENGGVLLEGVVSRKKQFVPVMMGMMMA